MKRAIAGLPRLGATMPACKAPFLSTQLPLFRYLAEHGKSLYTTRDEQVALFSDLADSIESPYDVAGFADLVLHFEFADPRDFQRATDAVSFLLERVDAPICGPEVLLDQFGLPVTIDKLAARAGSMDQSPYVLVLGYRHFVARLLGSPVCGMGGIPDEVEGAARRKLADALNRQIGALKETDLQPIGPEEMRRYETGRRILDEQPFEIRIASEVQKALLDLATGVRNSDLAVENPRRFSSAVDELIRGWKLWEPPASAPGLLTADAKFAALEPLCSVLKVPSICHRGLGELVSYLSNHSIKREAPDIWLGYITRLAAYANGTPGAASPEDPLAQDIFDRAPDPTIRLIVRAR